MADKKSKNEPGRLDALMDDLRQDFEQDQGGKKRSKLKEPRIGSEVRTVSKRARRMRIASALLLVWVVMLAAIYVTQQRALDANVPAAFTDADGNPFPIPPTPTLAPAPTDEVPALPPEPPPPPVPTEIIPTVPPEPTYPPPDGLIDID
jgi:hypothetical protein